MSARSVCLVALSLSEAGPGRFGRQVSIIDIYHGHTIRYLSQSVQFLLLLFSSVQFSSVQFSSVIYLPSVLVVCVGVFSFLVEMVG